MKTHRTTSTAPPAARSTARQPLSALAPRSRRALLLGGLHVGLVESLLEGLLGGAFGGLLAGGAGCAAPQATPSDFPAEAWPTSSPEALGFDSEGLLEVFDVIDAQRLAIHSLHIARHGRLALDACFHPFRRGERHDIASITKSITSLLVGIAIERGELPQGLDTPVWPLLDPTVPARDARTRITVRHLLTHSSGLDCGLQPYEREMLAMSASSDWVRYALALPLRDASSASLRQGSAHAYAYCSPGYHLLSALVTRVTGAAAEDFARARLFDPLGITDIRWPRDPQGVNQGAGDLQMQPLDLLRIGHLLLRRGRRDGAQLVPTAWAAAMARHQIDTDRGESYGLGWWLSRDVPGIFEAHGRGGQRLVVWPDADVTVVITGGGFDPAVIAPALLRAFVARSPLPANGRAYRRLLDRVAAASRPGATSPAQPSPWPQRAATLDGAEYLLEANALALRRLRLDFADRARPTLHVEHDGSTSVVPLGFDGEWREGIDPATGERIAGRAAWIDERSLRLEVDTIARINHFTIVLSFDGDGAVTGTLSERSGLVTAMPLRGQRR